MPDISGMPVLVSGGAGFLGRRIVAELERRAAKPSVVRSTDYDLTDPDRVRALFAEHGPQYVIHAAAIVGGIGANRAHPAKFFYDNAAMGLHLIEEARRAGVPKLVIVGTSCSYPKFTKVPFSETHLWDGYPEETNAPYGLAKKMLLVQSQAYREEYGFNSVYVIPTNLYGPGDNFDPETSHVIPAIILKCLEAQKRGDDEVVLWGSGNPTREFLYVDDAARAIVLALEHYDGPEPLNLGMGDEISIRELAELIAEMVGFQGRFVWDESKPDGQPRRALDGSRAHRSLGWAPKVRIRDGIEETITWCRQQSSGGSGLEYRSASSPTARSR